MSQILSSIKNNKILKNGGLFSIFSFFNKGIAFLLLMVLAKYISPDKYGSLNLFNTVVTFLSFTVGLSTAGYLGISYFKNRTSVFKTDLTSIILITITSALVFCLIIFLFDKSLTNVLKLNEALIINALYISLSSIISGLWLDYYRVKEKVLKYGIISCGFAILNFILTFYLIRYNNYGWLGFVYSTAICNTLFLILSVLYFINQKLLKFQFKWERIKTIIIWGVPLIPHSASNWIKQGLDRYIIDSYYSISEVGLFSFALNLTNIIVMIGVAFNQTNSVNIYKTLSVENTDRRIIIESLRNKERFFVLIYALITIAVVIGSYFLIPIYLPNYEPATKLFVFLSIFGLAHCYYLVYCNYLFYFNKNLNLMYITFGTSIIHLVLSLLFTRYSLYLTCIIYIISQVIITLLVYIQSRKLLNSFLYEKNL